MRRGESRWLLGASVTTLLLTAIPQSANAHDDNGQIRQLQQMIQQKQQQLDEQQRQLGEMQSGLEAKLKSLEAKEKATAEAAAKLDAASVVTKGDFPGSFKIPGTDTSVKIGGYVKLDVIHDLDGSTGAVFVPGAIPSANRQDKQHETRFQARQTRINLDARHPTPFGDSKVFVEFDFFGAGSSATTERTSNSFQPRLRHAFGEVTNLLVPDSALTAGQTWTTFMDVGSIPETLDFEGPNGEVFVRQAQIRWTQKIGTGTSVAVALENPEGDIEQGAGLNVDRFPDAVVRGRYEQPWGWVQLAGLVRELNFDDAQNTKGLGFADDTAVGYGGMISGRLNLPYLHKKDNFRYQAAYGLGIGRYIVDLGSTGGNDAVFDAGDEKVRPLPVFGGFVSYQHWWTERIRSTGVLGYVHVDNKSAQSGSATKENTYTAVNLIWSPVAWINLGIEYLHGYAKTKGGDAGDADRFQSSVQFLF